MGRSVAQRLVAFDETVVDVPAKLATRVRVYSTGHGTKTDNADAVAIARAAVHSKHLRRVLPDDATVAMKLLSDRRHELVGLRAQAMCRLHRLLRELIAGGALRQLSAEKAFDLLNDLKPDDPANEMRLEIAFDHIEDVMRLDRKIDDYNRRIVTEIKTCGTTLIRLYGVGPISAAVIGPRPTMSVNDVPDAFTAAVMRRFDVFICADNVLIESTRSWARSRRWRPIESVAMNRSNNALTLVIDDILKSAPPGNISNNKA